MGRSHQLEQLHLAIAWDLKPVTYVALGWETGQLHNGDTRCDAAKGIGHRLGVLSSSVIIVWQKNNVTAAKGLVVLGAPFSGTHGVCGCRDFDGPKTIHIPFAFDDEDSPFSGCVQ